MSQNFDIPAGYRELAAPDLIALVAETPDLAARLGGAAQDWRCDEISDGNMNAVWRLAGPAGAIVAKQALPYIRVIGEGWPFPVSRAEYEHRALVDHGRAAPGVPPRVHAYRPDLALIFMEALQPHVVARAGFVAGRRFPTLARDLGLYLARSLVGTSDLVLTTAAKNALVDRYSGNAELCATTQDVVFTGPYHEAPLNRLTPGQEGLAAQLRGDSALRLAAMEMKHAFRSQAEALIHGDLHTGSLMLSADETRVIDPEWAFVGPMGFDIGAVLGNLWLAAFSQPGHATAADDRQEMTAWLLNVAEEAWATFVEEATRLAHPRPGGLIETEVAGDGVGQAFVAARLAAVWRDTLGFAGAKMIRRILGISHVADFEEIADIPTRAACEARALRMARHLLLNRAALRSPSEVSDLARDIAQGRRQV
ncbi:S-methyl-5-thioribose kinase [Mesobaculum littorinae]|uniref:S-methyl-5-thioribose kinase n=1 Tax=Mesobaculum littorinae TaxID=2486419 RepID=A0A438ADN2_9RHOB|nr:S-methyl-5-thioribose kinase [Mesobaculum littorinae]RVV96777.1 S-methyl-5-thioribose kinase [Mesobaculum littorinae]